MEDPKSNLEDPKSNLTETPSIGFWQRIWRRNGQSIWQSDAQSIGQSIWYVVKHTIILAFTLTSIAGIHWLLNRLLEKDMKLFDILPVRYIIDTGHSITFVNFLWSLRELFRRKK